MDKRGGTAKKVITLQTAITKTRKTALQSGLVMVKGGRLELGDNVYGHNRSIFNHCNVIGLQAIEFGEKTQNTGYYAVQCHSRSSKSVSIHSPCATSC